jgi:hypothetical protein
MDDDLMTLKLRVGARGAKYVGVVVYDGNLHVHPSVGVRARFGRRYDTVSVYRQAMIYGSLRMVVGAPQA